MVALLTNIGRPYPSGAYGPRPGVILGEPDVERLLSRARMHEGDPRKVESYSRWRILTEDWGYLVARQIRAQWMDKETKEQLARFISGAVNVGADVTRQVAVAYKHGARRSLEGANNAESDAFTKLVSESWIDVHAASWTAFAFFLGPICVLPVVREGVLDWETLLPHYYDIVRDPVNPRGAPLAVSYTVESESDPVGESVDTVIVDGNSWRYYSTANGKTKQVDEIEHGAGTFPGSIFRLDVPYGTSWWGPPRAKRLFDATLDCGVINAALNFVRKSQNHKLLTLIADLSKQPQGQKSDPEAPVVLHQPRVATSQPSLEALDFDTSPEHFIRHIRFIIESAVEAYGIPAHTVTFDAESGSPGERMRISNEGLTEVRNEQIPFARRFEHELWAKTVRVIRAARHPLAPELPETEAIREQFRIEYPEMSRTFETLDAEIKWNDWMISKGQSSQIRILRSRHPTLTEEQAKKLMAKILQEQKEFNDEVTKRDLKMVQDDVMTAAEAFGATGPVMRDQNRRMEEGADEETDDTP